MAAVPTGVIELDWYRYKPRGLNWNLDDVIKQGKVPARVMFSIESALA